MSGLNRRNFLATLTTGALATACSSAVQSAQMGADPVFRYCLNTSTISGQDPGLPGYLEIASEAGYDGVELWVRDVKTYLEKGNSAASLKQLITEKGLTVEGAIGFAPWLKDQAGMDQMRTEMEMMKSIGCKRMAAPASGLTADDELDFADAGKKFHQLLNSGNELGIKPCLEFWGTSNVLWNMSQVLAIAAYANHPDVKILADVYHMFRGGSGFETLKMLNGNILELFHMNDYPDSIPRLEQTDGDRVYPGNGAAPMKQILTDLKNMGGEKVLSLELFNKNYWNRDPLTVAKTGLQKMKNLVKEIE
ncbi:sugar phosphate isomerase/epimerase family protein [uncultured Draconibacterium sp.]|uniref:sugar phosphate isomerase/epimerase family protein n=1 Tax=uncultured Draconibacterium sp. TaxID=1573823 RepID=UPI0029C8257D|nr:sugar phosphate isomerase/epimerase family protein [uncultured Draconibacterium sp.]